MRKKRGLSPLFFVLGGILTVVLTMAALIPFFSDILKVEVKRPVSANETAGEAPEAEELLVTALYEQRENSTKIDAIYIEVFCPGSNNVYYMEIPVQTRVTLSAELYKSLQAYSPELPQYLKLANMAEGFSKEYGMTGCNRILSEVLGVSVTHSVIAGSNELENWLLVMEGEKETAAFFEQYAAWIDASLSDLSETERWIYFESLCLVTETQVEQVPGRKETDGFAVSGKQAKARLEEMMLGR